MAGKQTITAGNMKVVKTLYFGGNRNDDELLAKVNTFSSLNPGISPKPLIRNLLLRTLDDENSRLQKEKCSRQAS